VIFTESKLPRGQEVTSFSFWASVNRPCVVPWEDVGREGGSRGMWEGETDGERERKRRRGH